MIPGAQLQTVIPVFPYRSSSAGKMAGETSHRPRRRPGPAPDPRLRDFLNTHASSYPIDVRRLRLPPKDSKIHSGMIEERCLDGHLPGFNTAIGEP